VLCCDLHFKRGNWPHNCDRTLTRSKHRTAGQVQRGIIRVVTGEFEQAPLAHAVNQASDTRPVLGARTHRARFHGTHKDAMRTHLSRKTLCGFTRDQGFSVIDLIHIALPKKYGAPIRRKKQRSEGVMPRLCSLCRNRDSLAKPVDGLVDREK
jgi:hypothetical protein